MKLSKKIKFFIFLIFPVISLTIFNGGYIFAKRKVIEKTPPQLRMKRFDNHMSMRKNSPFKNLPWQFLGPINISGRMTDVAVVQPKGENYTIYVAGASGGIWKTENEGTTWTPIFENQASAAIGDIAIAPSDQRIIWAGTGEANIFRSSNAGSGIYRSTDSGKSWKHMGLTDTNTIARIVINPKDPNIVYVAAGGNEWTNNSARGVYKTVDGGLHWNKILYVNNKTGANDLVMDPKNPEIIYASFWQRIRKKGNDPRNEKGYSGSGIFKTDNGGKTWASINKGLPLAEYRGRIGLDLCRSKSNIIYAFIDNYEIVRNWKKDEIDSYGRPKMGLIKGATIYRSDDSGLNWRQVSQDNEYMQHLSSTYGWVFGQIRVDPVNENKIYVMGLGLNMSEDGGKTFKTIGNMHGDHHGLWIDPKNPNYLVNVNDGGLAISYDGGMNFRTFADNMPLVQFFNVMYDTAKPFHVYGSVQDHGSFRCAVDLSKGRNNIQAVKWEWAPGGEGSSHAIDPADPNTVYSAGFYGNITRTNMKTKDQKLIVPKPEKGEPPYRGQWLAPFIIPPENPKEILLGMNFLFRSTDKGSTWEKISRDLTYNLEGMKGDIPYQTIFSISESPLKKDLIYVGTDDGRVHITKNGGKYWREIDRRLPYRKWVSRIVASKYSEGTVYITQNGKRDDDFNAYIWKSNNYGRKWRSIVANIPCGPVNVIREDPLNKNILYVGTDYGVYVSINGGNFWYSLPKNLPNIYVHDLVIQPRDNIMVIATHGRGMYAMDVSFLQNLKPENMEKGIFLFKPEKAKIAKRRWWYWYGGIKSNIGFYLKQKGEVNITIKESSGKIVKNAIINGDQGLNFFEWDLKKDKADRKEPFVKPGVYKIELKSGNSSAEGKIEVIK